MSVTKNHTWLSEKVRLTAVVDLGLKLTSRWIYVRLCCCVHTQLSASELLPIGIHPPSPSLLWPVCSESKSQTPCRLNGMRPQASVFSLYSFSFFHPPTPSPPSACYHYKPVPSCYPVPVRHLSREAVDLAAAISTNHRAVFINAYTACITLPWWHFEFQHNQNKGQVFELCSSNDHVEPFSPRPKQQFYRTLSPAWMLKVPGTECFMVSCFAMSCLWNPSVSGAKSLLRHTVQTTVC